MDREKLLAEQLEQEKLQEEKQVQELQKQQKQVQELKELKELQELKELKELQNKKKAQEIKQDTKDSKDSKEHVNSSENQNKIQHITIDCWKTASEYLKKIWYIKKTIKPLMKSNPSMMQQVFKGKMTITTRIGQFNHLQSKVIEIAQSIDQLLGQFTSQVEIQEYLMYLIAKQLVLQAEKEIAGIFRLNLNDN